MAEDPPETREERTTAHRRTARVWTSVAFIALLLALSTLQPANFVGDEGEYLAVAVRVGRGERPSLDAAAYDALQTELAPAGIRILAPRIERRDGRRDFGHFYAYSAVAAPIVTAARRVGLPPRAGFLLLNVLLLGLAMYVASGRLSWPATWLLCLSPIIWWVGRAHTEAFSFSLLIIALSLLEKAPGMAMLCLGTAAAQNPPIAGLLVAVPIALAIARPDTLRRPSAWVGGLIGLGLALVHPMYYWLANGALTGVPNRASLPTVQELGAVLWDANVGLLPNDPWIALALILGGVGLARWAPSRLVRAGPLVALAGATAFLVAFSQTVNFNSAATPGMSRYALWFLPLGVPLLAECDTAFGRRWGRSLVALAVVGCAWSVLWFNPARPEGHGRPTRLAQLLWTRWPWMTNPLPEIFAERLSGSEAALVPIATPGCRKVLLSGNERFTGMWPIPCPPVPTPPICRTPNRLCYANWRDGGYAFVVLADRGFAFPRGGQRAWPIGIESTARQLLQRMNWASMRRLSAVPNSMLRAAEGATAVDGLEGEDRLFLAIVQPGRDAGVTLRPHSPMRGAFIVAERPTEPISVDLGQVKAVPWELPVPESALAILYLE